jgi:AcrR family transcriptional regulator
MAASGTNRASGQTRRSLVDAAVTTLREDGFAGASARVIAQRAGCNQALVFYHFGTVRGLLLAALDEVSAQRMSAYQRLVEDADSLPDLLTAARTVFEQDLDDGHVAVLLEMLAGARTDPELAAQVTARLVPWKEFAARAIGSVLEESPAAGLVSGPEAAHLTVGLYLGLELLASLEGERQTVLDLCDRARLGLRLLDLAGGLSSLWGGSAGS